MPAEPVRREIDEDLTCVSCAYLLRGQAATWRHFGGGWEATCPNCNVTQSVVLSTPTAEVRRAAERIVAAVFAAGSGVMAAILFAAGHVGTQRGIRFESYLREMGWLLLLSFVAIGGAVFFATRAMRRDDEPRDSYPLLP